MEGLSADSRSAAPIRPWRSPRVRGNWTLFFTVAYLIIVLSSIASTLAEIDLLQRIANGEPVTESEAVSNDNRQLIIGLLYFVVYVGLVISFLMWMYRASKNLASLGVNQWFSPAWSVGWWFVPIASLWQPFRAISEIWKGSHPEGTSRSPMLWVWWIAFLISNWIATMSLRVFAGNLEGDSIDDWILEDTLIVASDMLSIPAGLLLIWVVWQITNSQIRKRKYIEARNELLAPGATG